MHERASSPSMQLSGGVSAEDPVFHGDSWATISGGASICWQRGLQCVLEHWPRTFLLNFLRPGVDRLVASCRCGPTAKESALAFELSTTLELLLQQ
jgi:hypothetical protein